MSKTTASIRKGGNKMSASLKQICFQMWNPMYERKGIQSEFKPLFIRYIGVEIQEEYDDILKTLMTKCEEHQDKSLIFDTEISLGDAKIVSYFSEQLKSVDINHLTLEDITLFDNKPELSRSLIFDTEISLGDAKIVSYFSEQLKSVDINHLTLEDITLFDNKPELSSKYLTALNEVIALATEKENFFNENIKRNFIKKLIVWSYHYLRNNNIRLEESVNPKCIYYGDITRHEIYFLIILFRMGFDVLYINPLREENWKEIDQLQLSELHKNKQILSIESLKKRVANGKILNQTESSTLQLERELENQFYTDGVYRPWQFRNGNTESFLIHSTITDIDVSFHEPAKVRMGFSVRGNVVRIPHFFQKIDGEFADFKKYKTLVKKCMQGDHVLFLSDRGESLLPQNLNRDDMLSLAFCMNGDGSCNIKKIKECPFYPLKKYSQEVQDFILGKINEVLLDPCMFTNTLNKEEKLSLLMFYLHIDEKIVRLIDNFDYPNQVPKFVLFLEKEDCVLNEMQ